jgi:transposase
MAARKFAIVFGIIIIFGAVFAMAIDWDNVDLPDWIDDTYKPVIYSKFTLCKTDINSLPQFTTAISDDQGGQIFGLLFGYEAKVRMKVIGPDTSSKTFTSPLVDVDWASCPWQSPLNLNPEVKTTIQWRAWKGPGTYTLQFKLLDKNDLEVYPGQFKTTQVVIGEDAANTNFPQQHNV